MRRKIFIGAGILACVVFICVLVVILFVSTYNYNKFKPQISAIAEKYTGRKLTISGNINVKISLSPTLEVGNVSFQNAPWSSHPNMIHAKRIEIQLALIPLIHGEVNVKRLILLDPDLMIEINQSGKTNLEFNVPEQKRVKKTPVTKGESETTLFNFKEILIRDGKLTVQNHQTNKTYVFAIDRYTEKSTEFMGEADIELKGSFNDIPLNVSGHVGSVEGIINPNIPFPIDIKAEVAQMKLAIAGKIQDPVAAKGIDVRVSASGDDLAEIQDITREPLPLKGPFQISGHLIAANLKKIQASDMMIQLENSKLSGFATLDLSANKPQIFTNMTSETLDLRPIFARSETKAGAGKGKDENTHKKSKKLFEHTPLKLDILHRINAVADIRIKHLLLPRLALDNIQTKVNLQNGDLTAHPLTAGIGGGRLDSRLNFKAIGNVAHVDLNMDIKQMEIGEMLKKLEITKSVEGTLDLDVDFTGYGNSVAAIMADSNGKVIATLGQGKIPMGYLDYISADIGSSFMHLINPFEKKRNNARINCAVCDFHITNGIAKSKVIIVDDPEKTLFSQGTINLKTEALDFHIETKPKEGIGTKETGKLSISLSKITRPFKLTGTLTHPSLGIDLMNTATTIGTALLGPVGWAYLLLSVSHGNPCKKALEIAEKDTSEKASKTEKGKAGTSGVVKKIQGIGNKILNIFK